MKSTEIKSSCQELKEKLLSKGNLPDIRLDGTIQADIWLAFWQADDCKALDISEIEVLVQKCEVWLSGQVEDEGQRILAECLVSGINGVSCCHNALMLK